MQPSRQRGFMMVEVLMAVLVLSVGMMGIAGMLVWSHKSNSSSYVKQQSVQSAYDIFDAMRANRGAAVSGAYDTNNLSAQGAVPALPHQPSADCSNATCDPQQLAVYDKWYWLTRNLTRIPQGSGMIATTVSGESTLVTVTVQWDDSSVQSKLGATSATDAASPNLVHFTLQSLL